MEEELSAEKLLRKAKGGGFDFDRVLDGEGNEALRNLHVDGEENLHSVSISCDSERELLEMEVEKGYEVRVAKVMVDVYKGNGENAQVGNRSRKRRKVNGGQIEDGSRKVVKKVKRKVMADKLRGSDRILRSSFAVKTECGSVADSEENNSSSTVVQNCRTSKPGKKTVKLKRGNDDQLFSGDQKVKRKRGRPRKVEKEAEEVVVSIPTEKEAEEGVVSIPTEKKAEEVVVSSPMEKLKRKRGRPPKLKCENNHQLVCESKTKLKRKRGRPPKIKKENDNPLVGGLDSLKPKRGRPRKLQQSNGALKDEHTERRKVRLARKLSMKLRNRARNIVPTTHRHIRKEIHMKKTLPPENDLSQEILDPEAALATSSKVITCGDKIKKVKKAEKSKIKVRSVARNLLREKITEILITAGWTIQYRPRLKREYMDAVYVSPEGRTHWSITLAYNVLKRRYEVGDGDCKVYKTGFTFTPIPDEEIRTLTRVRKARRAREDDEVKNQSRNEKKKMRGFTNKTKCKEKASSPRGPVSRSIKRKRKKDMSHHGFDNPDHNLEKGFPSSFRTKNRKRCALRVRNTEEIGNSCNDGYLLYNGKRTLLAWMIDLGILSLDEKVQYMNQRKTRVKLEGRLTRDGIHCNCCDDVITISKFEMHAGSGLGQPLENIYVNTGSSLLQCLLESWNKQNEPQCKGYNFVDVDVEDPNDDTCGICGDGGDLICCDSCPSTFHQSCLDIKVSVHHNIGVCELHSNAIKLFFCGHSLPLGYPNSV